MSNHTDMQECSIAPTCKTTTVVIATIFALFTANIKAATFGFLCSSFE